MAIKAGVVCMTQFCSHDGKEFGAYISYMDRDEATKIKERYKFNLFEKYLDYVGNTEKMGSLWTKDKDVLTKNELNSLKEAFKAAQDNKSNMWQTVISFDTEYLQKIGVMTDDFILNEKALRTAARKGISAMLENENMQNAVWTASFHYNTDNVHIHIAIVEPVPTREKITYKAWKIHEKGLKQGKYVYEKNEKTGQMEKVPILDKNGNQLILEGYRGKFKESSMHGTGGLRSVIVSELENCKEQTKEITMLLRGIVEEKKERNLLDFSDFEPKMMSLYKELKNMGKNKKFYPNMWNYNRNIMKDLRPKIDEISNMFIERYKKEDFEYLVNRLEEREAGYTESYGGENIKYKENKLKDLYSRLGNTILKELAKYDKRSKEDRNIVKNICENAELSKDERIEMLENEHFKGNELATWQLAWEYFDENTADGYIKASKYFSMCKADKAKLYADTCKYKSAVSLLDSDTPTGIEILKELDNKGNTYATVKLGMLYYKGDFVEKSYSQAKKYFEKASVDGNEMAQQILDNISKPYIDHTRTRKKYRPMSLGRNFNAMMYYLFGNMDKEYENYKNLEEYEELQYEIENRELNLDDFDI